MASTQLPTPGRLILENITLLAGSPTAFHTRYGFTLTPTTFSKPGNTAPANAVLHFLISTIDADVADSLFKPCFPILDRDQERDFRKVVDTRLAILERTKLIPTGCARKSVVAAAGGDRFLDLLWSLSSLALQQACLRHPAYASVSRMRLLSQAQSDTSSHHSFSQQPASRSSRSLLPSRSSRLERPPADPSRHRRFLGVGMLSASQQRQKDAEQMRARIDSERNTLNRTTEMGQQGAKTWASEADSLRERIGEFEAKLRRLKGQLADMGFDENGNDVRAKCAQTGHVPPISDTKPPIDAASTGGPLVPSSSGDDLLKTSPIESTESCSSVDDTVDACDDLAADLSRLLTFTVESEGQRVDVEDAVQVDKPVIPFSIVNSTEVLSGCEAAADEEGQRKPKDILHLVRVATDELEEATNRMHEIREARDRAGMDEAAEIGTDVDVDEQIGEEALEPAGDLQQQDDDQTEKEIESESLEPVADLQQQDDSPSEKEDGSETLEPVADVQLQGDSPTEKVDESETLEPVADLQQQDDSRTEKEFERERDSELTEKTASDATSMQQPDNLPGSESTTVRKGADEAEPISEVEDPGPSVDTPASLEQKVAEVLEEHNVVVESSRRLQKEAAALSAKAAPMPTPEDDNLEANSSSRDTFVDALSKPHWYTSAAANSTRAKKNSGPASAPKKHGKPPRGHVNTLLDVSVAAKAMQGYGSSLPSRSAAARRRKEGTRSLDSINLDLNSIDKRSCSSQGNEMDILYSPSESNSSLKGTPRSVRFAALPPSYSATRTSDNSRESSPVRNERGSDEQFVERVSQALESRGENKGHETLPGSGQLKEQVIASILEENAEKDGQTKEVTGSPVSKTGSRSTRKYEGMLRSDTYMVKSENGRTGTVSSQRPPRVQRSRTAHRVVRPKDAGQRPGAFRQQLLSNTQPGRPFSSRSASLDNISSLRKSRAATLTSARDFEDRSLGVDSTEVEGKANLPDSPKEAPKQLCSEIGPRDGKCETRSPQPSDEETVEDSGSAKKEPVQKKLFMTPESAVSSSKTTRPLSRLTRRSNTTILPSSNQGNATSTSSTSKTCDVMAVVKDSSAEFPSADDEELLFSPAAKPPLPEKSATKKVNSGFFAGQTAEWQQSVRAQSDTGRRTATMSSLGSGRQTPTTSSRGLSENSGRLGRNGGKPSSGMRSRVQSLRARLAALK